MSFEDKYGEQIIRDPRTLLDVYKSWRSEYPERDPVEFIDWASETLDMDVFEVLTEDEAMTIMMSITGNEDAARNMLEGLGSWP